MTDGEAKLPINVCSFEELAVMPGLAPAQAGIILGLRTEHGNITPELFEASPGLVESRGLLSGFDFSPRETTRGAGGGGAPSQDRVSQSVFSTPSGQRAPNTSTPCGAQAQAGGQQYPYDVYPPPFSNQGDVSGRPWGVAPTGFSTPGGMNQSLDPHVSSYRARGTLGEDRPSSYQPLGRADQPPRGESGGRSWLGVVPAMEQGGTSPEGRPNRRGVDVGRDPQVPALSWI